FGQSLRPAAPDAAHPPGEQVGQRRRLGRRSGFRDRVGLGLGQPRRDPLQRRRPVGLGRPHEGGMEPIWHLKRLAHRPPPPIILAGLWWIVPVQSPRRWTVLWMTPSTASPPSPRRE